MIRFISAVVLTFGLLFVSFQSVSAAENTAAKLSGRILLQVQDKGQAWYVNPVDKQVYYMGRPADAFALMKRLGTGISNNDLRKIPVAPMNYYGTPDTDHDGLSDAFEQIYGTDMNNPDTDYDGITDWSELNGGTTPFGLGTQTYDKAFAKAQKGKIFIQVQQGGAAWYVNPVDLKAYYLGKPLDAFNVMRALGLGVSNETLAQAQGRYVAVPPLQYAPYPYNPYYPYNPNVPYIPYYPNPTPVTPSPSPYYSSRWYVRMYNIDDVGTAMVNGSTAATTSYGGDSGFVDITKMIHTGDNSINFKLHNNVGGYTWGFQIKKDNTIVFDEKAGTAGSYGANNNDGSMQYQDVYNKNITVNESGVLTMNSLQPTY